MLYRAGWKPEHVVSPLTGTSANHWGLHLAFIGSFSVPPPCTNSLCMPTSHKKTQSSAKKFLTHYLRRTRERLSLDQDGTATDNPAVPAANLFSHQQQPATSGSEYTAPLTKENLEHSLKGMYTKLAAKFQTELHKTSKTLSQELGTLGNLTDRLETKHDELSIGLNDLSRESLVPAFAQVQSLVEDLDNRSKHNNPRIREFPKSVTDLMDTALKLFKSLLPDQESLLHVTRSTVLNLHLTNHLRMSLYV